MRRITSAGIPVKVFAVLVCLALLLLLLPMLKAAQYDVPAADDYSNGLPTYRAWVQTGSIGPVLKAAWDRVYDLYFGWQGTFSAIFLFTLNPMIFGEQYYQIGPWLILTMLMIGNFVLIFTVFGRLFNAPKAECCIIAAVWSILCTQFLPRASQGIYWYTGAVYYTLFFSFSALAFAVLLRFLLRKEGERGTGRLITASIMFLIVGGGNLVTGLTTAVVLVSMEAFLLWKKRSDWKPMLIPVLCYMVSFGLNVAAPGNSARQTFFAQPGLFEAVWLSFRQAALSLGKWFTLPVWALILILVPVLWRIAVRTGIRFEYPALVTLYSICLTGVMFYPPIYAMTEHNLNNLGRITNIIFFGMLFLAIFNFFYWIGWLVQRKSLTERCFPAAEKGRYSAVLLLLLLIVFAFGMTRIKWYDTTSISAFRSYRSTQMGNYWHTYKQRLEILKDPSVEDAVLKRFPYRPYVLFYMELSEYPEENTPVASWYGKNTVVVR